ncbi:hypothetical protein [Weissella confusa]|uniref:hypothetical protein n=1 Tax=Weissella confusa TaxID=1583 RepID=UPI00108148FE|nr:hypothetical protein [Weissella confusa]MBJ7628187.1 hypothetical protein [Weissella confusa]TGE49195.1 hypothetical protein C6P23_03580 [Weissella confusa]
MVNLSVLHRIEAQLIRIAGALENKKAPSNDGAIHINVIGEFTAEDVARRIENQSAKSKL